MRHDGPSLAKPHANPRIVRFHGGSDELGQRIVDTDSDVSEQRRRQARCAQSRVGSGIAAGGPVSAASDRRQVPHRDGGAHTHSRKTRGARRCVATLVRQSQFSAIEVTCWGS